MQKEEIVVIGVAGHPACGKDEVAKHLEKKGLKHISGGNLIRGEMEILGLKTDRDSVSKYIAKQRAKLGNHYPYEDLNKLVNGHTVVSGLRNIAEHDAFKGKFGDRFHLIVADCPIKIRYDRAQSRKREGDLISFEEFQRQEENERNADSGSHEVDRVIEKADIVLQNDGTLEDLYRKIDIFLKEKGIHELIVMEENAVN